MQKNIIPIMFFCLLVIAACSQREVAVPSFDVAAQKSTYKVGDTVRYTFNGNPDFITFYSGEIGKRFEYANRISAEGTPVLQFTSARANGSQPNSLLIMVSTDFEGPAATEEESVVNINKATWTDITSKAKLSTGSAVGSGAIDLSEFAAGDKPAYIAFKYVAEAGSTQNKWTITNFKVSNELSDGTSYQIANHTSTSITNYGVNFGVSPGWATYRSVARVNWSISTSSLVITGATSAGSATAPVETWSITGPVDLKRVSPDLGTYVKGMTTKETAFIYNYNSPGTYTSTFVGANNLLGDEKREVKKISITVTE